NREATNRREATMKGSRLWWAQAGAAFVASMSAQAQVKIGVITSATGPTAFVGIPQKNSVALLPQKVGDLSIEYVSYDDASDSTQSVQLTKKLIAEDKVDARSEERRVGKECRCRGPDESSDGESMGNSEQLSNQVLLLE